jgi:hypothetical protein
MRKTGLMFFVLFLVASANAEEMAYPIAGEKPDARPEGAPRLVSYDKGSDWYTRSLIGVSRPYVLSLRFLEDQGAWYTPFTVPGMTGPYDIRNWHAFSP